MDLVWYPLPNWHRPHQRLLSSRGGGLIHLYLAICMHSIHPYIIFRTAPREKLPSLHFKLCIWRSKPCVPSFVPVNLNSLKLRNIWIQHNSTTLITWVHMFMAHHGSTFNKPFLVARGICREPDFAAAGGAFVSLDEIKEVHSQFQETAWVTGPMEVMLPWKSQLGTWIWVYIIVGVEWIEMRTSFCIAVARNPGNIRRPHPETSWLWMSTADMLTVWVRSGKFRWTFSK